MVSAVSPTGELKFRCFTGRFTSEEFIAFVADLAADNDGRPLFVVCDNAAVHKSRKVYEFLVATEHDIEIFFLPPYAPELNADEWVWNHLKNHTVARKPIYRGTDIHHIVETGLRELAARTDVVVGFFRDVKLRYILESHNIVY